MSSQDLSASRTQPHPGSPGDHLANERTFLAWLRTSVSLITFGVTINRFSLYLGDLEAKRGRTFQKSPFADVEHVGLGLVIYGLLVLAIAVFRWTRTSDRLKRGEFYPDPWAIWVTTLAIALFGGFSTVWLITR